MVSLLDFIRRVVKLFNPTSLPFPACPPPHPPGDHIRPLSYLLADLARVSVHPATNATTTATADRWVAA